MSNSQVPDPRVRASDPTTPLTELAQLAYDHPDVRPIVAANPAAYEGLLHWLGQLGDPAVDQALRARAAGVPPPPGCLPPAQGTASGTAGPPPSQAPPSGGRHGNKRVWLIAGIAAAVVVALVVVGVLIAKPQPTASPGGVPRVQPYLERPTSAWQRDAQDLGLAPDSLSDFSFAYFGGSPNLIEAGGLWILPYTGPAGLVGIDPAQGRTRWDSADTLDEPPISCAEQLYDGALLCLLGEDYGGSTTLVQIDPATGNPRAAAWKPDFAASVVYVQGGDVYLLGTGSTVQRLKVAKMSGPTRTVWSQSYPLSESEQSSLNHAYGSIAVRDGLVVAHLDGISKVIDDVDGTLLDSNADTWVTVWPDGYYAMASGGYEDAATWEVYRKGSTVPVWDAPGSMRYTDTSSNPRVFLHTPDDDSISAYDRHTGTKQWTKSLEDISEQGVECGILYADNDIVVAASVNGVLAWRAADGSQLWRNHSGLDVSSMGTFTDGARVFAVDQGASEIVAINLADGSVTWRWQAPIEGWVGLRHAGDTLIAYDDSGVLTALQP